MHLFAAKHTYLEKAKKGLYVALFSFRRVEFQKH
jgi:hypothetical protein